MVVGNLDIVRVSIQPPKAESPLVIDAYAVLALPITLQCLQSIPRWVPKIIQGTRLI